MSTLDRYIAWTLLKGWLMVWLIVTAIFSLLALVEELEHVGKLYQTSDAIKFVLYTLPQRSIDLAPVIALLGTLIALARLNKNSELVALRASGIPLTRFMRSVLLPAIMLAATLLAATEYITAPLHQVGETERTAIRSGHANLLKGMGLWSRNGNRFFNVRTLKHGHVPNGIYLYEFAENGSLKLFIYSARARLNENRKWALINAREKTWENNIPKSQRLKELNMGPFWSREELPVIPLSTAGMSISGLYEYVKYLKDTGQNTDRFELAFWQKLTLPLTAACMVLLATPIGGSLETQRSGAFGRQLAIGASAGILFYLGSQLVSSAGSLTGLPPTVTAFIPIVTILFISTFLLARMR